VTTFERKGNVVSTEGTRAFLRELEGGSRRAPI
jgi:hypothetical protein